MHHNELTLAIWNNGWTCEGAGLYPGGCDSGFSEFYKTWNQQGYFNKDDNICLCLKCAEKGKTLKYVTKWNASYT